MQNVPATSSTSYHPIPSPRPETIVSVEFTEVKFRVRERTILDVPAGIFAGGTITSILGPSGSVCSFLFSSYIYSRVKRRS